MQELVNAEAPPRQRLFFWWEAGPQTGRSAIVAMNRIAVERCNRAGFRDEVWYRPNPIDEGRFTPEFEHRQIYRRELTPFSEKDVVLCSVAKFMPRKNQLFLVEVLSRLPTNYKLLLAGPAVTSGKWYERDQAYLEHLRDVIKWRGVEDRVHLTLGFVDAARYMKASDVYCLPAWDEEFGTPMLEAMACGLPVIANSQEPAFVEWVKPGQTGFLCPLIEDRWVMAAKAGSCLQEDELRSASAHVQRVAGQTVVYEEYKNWIYG